MSTLFERCQKVMPPVELGLLLLSCGCYKNVVRFIAPTIVEKKDIDKAIKIVDEVLNKENI